MNKTGKLGLSSLLTAGALGAALLQAPAASANPGFVCPAGSDTIPARYGTAAGRYDRTVPRVPVVLPDSSRCRSSLADGVGDDAREDVGVSRDVGCVAATGALTSPRPGTTSHQPSRLPTTGGRTVCRKTSKTR